jgi:hypothetical protein
MNSTQHFDVDTSNLTIILIKKIIIFIGHNLLIYY